MLSVPVSVLGISDGRPEINSAFVNETNNELVVRWTSTHAGIVNFAVNALDNITGNKYSAVVGSNISETALALCNPKNSFQITVIAFDICRNFSSDLFVIDGDETTPTSSIGDETTPTSKIECDKNEGSQNEGSLCHFMCHFVISTY